MLLIAVVVWAVFGLLGHSQQKDNLAVSVDHQKRISQIATSGRYFGFNWLEALGFAIFNLVCIIGSILGGILWYILVLRISKVATARRLEVEKTHKKMYGSGWCS